MNSQKGVVLIITFFIMTVLVAIVLGIVIIMANEIKITRNIGDSVVAYYAAESGVEKVLYYDRQQVPQTAARGFCDICQTCPNDSSNDSVINCKNCTLSGQDCNVNTCQNCEIKFDTDLDADKKYSIDALVYPDKLIKAADLDIFSGGFYKNTTTRKIKINVVTPIP